MFRLLWSLLVVSCLALVPFLFRGPAMCDRTLQYFCGLNRLSGEDAAEVRWAHAANGRRALREALTGPAHMVEADVILRGRDPREPVMAHPPDTDGDVTLGEWLQEVRAHSKGIKLDFKSLEAVPPSLVLLEGVLAELSAPVWINADILCGPGGRARPVDAEAFLSAVTSLPAHTTLSLGWTTGWTPAAQNPGYSWDMVRAMEQSCRDVKHPVTFAVRAALLAQSSSQLSWLLHQSDRYSLTVWTTPNDEFSLQDLLPFRAEFGVSRMFCDLPDSIRTGLLTPQDRT